MRSLATSLLALACLAHGPAPSAQQLLIDFNGALEDADPAGLTHIPGGPVFAAETPSFGRELWKTTGEVGNANQIADIEPGLVGSNPRKFSTLADGDALFVATTSALGGELYRTDGTTAGTTLVRDISPGALSSEPARFVRVGDNVFFFASDGTTGTELWKTDGTSAGTTQVADVRPGPLGAMQPESRMRRFGADEVLFSARFPDGWQVWRSDGSEAGTIQVATVTADTTSPPLGFQAIGDDILFYNSTPATGYEPWITDGTAAGTELILDINPGPDGSSPTMIIGVGDIVFLGATDGTDVGIELWKTDGTAQGTVLVRDIAPMGGESDPPSSSPGAIAIRDGELYFAGLIPMVGRRVFKTDGTTAGTVEVASISHPLYNSGPGFLFQGEIYLHVITIDIDHELWKIRADLSTEKLGDFKPNGFAYGAGGIVVSGSGIPVTTELWKTDGTAEGTIPFPPLTDPPVTGSSEFTILGSFRSRIVFESSDFSTQPLLFSTAGIPDSLEFFLLLSNPKSFVTRPAFSFFFATSPGGVEHPYLTLGLQFDQLYELNLPNSNGGETVVFGDQVVFSANGDGVGQELYITFVNSGAGATLIKDIVPGVGDSSPRNLRVCADKLYFTATSASKLNEEVWVTDGTEAGTLLLAAASKRLAESTEFVCVGDNVYFSFRDDDHGQEIWSTDGTPGGTFHALDLNPGTDSSSPNNLRAVGDRLVFVAEDGSSAKLWSSDGTTAGTLELLDAQSSLLSDLGALGDELALFFRNNGGAAELWSTDGASVTFVQALAPPPAPGLPGWTMLGDSKLTFAANDGSTGPELWTTDGTTAGTFQLFDMGPTSIAPSQMTRLGREVVFRGNDGIVGTEMFKFPFGLTGDYAIDPFGYGCTGPNGVIPTIAVVGKPVVSEGSFEIVVTSDVAERPAFLILGEGASELEIATNCIIWPAAPLNVFTTATDASGFASFTIPAIPNLLDRNFLAQWALLDPNGVSNFVSVSAALEIIVGP